MIFLSFVPIAFAGVITDATPISGVLANVLQWLLQIFGVIAIATFVGSGFLYLLAGGNSKVIDRAKKWMMYSVFGVIVALGALVMLSTIDSLL